MILLFGDDAEMAANGIILISARSRQASFPVSASIPRGESLPHSSPRLPSRRTVEAGERLSATPEGAGPERKTGL